MTPAAHETDGFVLRAPGFGALKRNDFTVLCEESESLSPRRTETLCAITHHRRTHNVLAPHNGRSAGCQASSVGDLLPPGAAGASTL